MEEGNNCVFCDGITEYSVGESTCLRKKHLPMFHYTMALRNVLYETALAFVKKHDFVTKHARVFLPDGVTEFALKGCVCPRVKKHTQDFLYVQPVFFSSFDAKHHYERVVTRLSV